MKLPSIAIKNAQFTITLVVLLVLVGIVSYLNMPRSEDPQFDLPITLVEIVYPGASATDIETLVVDVLEDEISDIEHIKKVESEVRNGGARVTIEFLYGVDGETSFNKVKQSVSAVKPKLPEGVQELLVIKATPTSVAIAQLALWNEQGDYKEMEYYAKLLEKRLEAIKSVRKASRWGYPTQVVSVDVNLSLIKQYKLSLLDVESVLKGRALNITPGFVDASTRRFNLKASGNYTDLDVLADTIIASTDDYVLRLKDVAEVKFGNLEPTYLAFYDDKPVIFLTLEQAEKTNIFDVTRLIEDEIERFREAAPSSIKIDVLFKQSDSVEARVNGFFDNLWQGLVLVGVMSLLFLGVREAIVVILAIPISFLIAIGWLDFSGFGLQQMSIVGLIIALGLLVDNAIVVTESIHREKQQTSSLLEASRIGTSKVGWAIASGTITTMLAFLPMLMLNSVTGDFVRSLPVTVVLVLLASLLVALTLTPLLASRLFKASSSTSKIKTLQHYINHFASSSYSRFLQRLIAWKSIVLISALVVLVGMFSLFPKVGVSLFPKAEKPMLLIDVETPDNASFSNTKIVMFEVASALKTYDFIEKVALNVGNSNPRIYYNEIPKRGRVKFGQILLVLQEYDTAKVESLVKNLRSEFSSWAKAKITVKEFTQGPVTDQPITVRLISDSLSDLERVANDVDYFLSKTKGVINIENPIGEANTELEMIVDYDKAGLSLVDINQLDSTLKTIISGTNVGLYRDYSGEDYPIVIRNEQQTVESLADIEITNGQGNKIPLNQLAHFQLKKGKSDFFHFQQLRMAKVSADAGQGYSINELTEKLVNYLERYPLPKGMYYNLGGEEESRQESFAGLTQIMLITAIGIFAVLVLQFRSLLQPLIIFSSIPFAMAGAIVGLYLVGLSFSMMAFIGLISLFGIVVNNAIILIDTSNRHVREGIDLHSAIILASSTRFTPILLTTLTTIAGLIPLTVLGGGLWQPLGVVIISGLCLSALSSFLLVPALITVFTRK